MVIQRIVKSYEKAPHLKELVVADSSPGVTQDINSQYDVGCRWFNSTTKTWYTCSNPGVGAAVWEAVPANSAVYGDSADGDLDFIAAGSTAVAGATLSSGVYTMTRDIYAGIMTVETTVVIKTAGYRIFAQQLINNGTIQRNGNAGSSGTSGTAGAALAATLLGASGAGGAGNAAAGSAGGAVTSSIGGAGGVGGDGITSGGSVGGAAGGATVPAAANGGINSIKLLPSGLAGSMLNSTTLLTGGAGGGGGGGAVIIFSALAVPATQTVSVAGGAGGALVSGTGATAGANGVAGNFQTNIVG